MVLVRKMITKKYFPKSRRKNSKNNKIYSFFIRKRNAYSLR